MNLEICERRIQAINDTKIKYLTVDEKVYEVASIDLNNETLLAIETDSNVSDVPESELWDLDDLRGFRIKFRDWKWNIIDIREWKTLNGLSST